MTDDEAIRWVYLPSTGSTLRPKHALKGEGLRHSAICGTAPVWYLPNGWRTDEQGLALRRECIRCTGLIERSKAFRLLVETRERSRV